MNFKSLAVLSSLLLAYPMVSEAGWQTRIVCQSGVATGGGGSTGNTACWTEAYWVYEGSIHDPLDPGMPGGGGGWTPTYSEYYTDAHSCAMSEYSRHSMVASAVRYDVLQEQGSTGSVSFRRLEIRGPGGSREQFEIVAGVYTDPQLIGGNDFVRLVPGTCQSGTGGT